MIDNGDDEDDDDDNVGYKLLFLRRLFSLLLTLWRKGCKWTQV